MKAALVRIGVDHSYGHWNAPADPASQRFVYVPIPEAAGTRFHMGCKRPFSHVFPAVEQFADEFGLDPVSDLWWPVELKTRAMHLDPDFDTLTYGDVGDRRGSYLRDMSHGDVVVFYAGLRSIGLQTGHLIYAIVGMFIVDEVVVASDVPPERFDENAHTRRLRPGKSDIVVRAVRGRSGRLARFLPIGEYRDRAYRVRRDLLEAWGGLSVNDGYIQRSAVPPRFLNPERFLEWFNAWRPELLQANNEAGKPPVFMVHLRRPTLSNPSESRADPFWEFGSFGCTGCHRTNLMHPRRADELDGARLVFAQGGPAGFKLVKLTPPVTVVHHGSRIEVRWDSAEMPFKYESAPLLVDNRGETDFPSIRQLVAVVRKPTWMGKFSSKFRSNRTPLPHKVARELVEIHDRMAGTALLAATYDEALPFPPPVIDRKRKQTYRECLSGSQGAKRSRCRRAKSEFERKRRRRWRC